YTDQLWLDAAVEWLAATDQPIDALSHPKFKAMIDIAARATQGVTIPNRKQTRAEIINLFHDQMDKLKIRLHVCFFPLQFLSAVTHCIVNRRATPSLV
ncbi:hypothetical protein FB451DRAFT_1056943, partial [Mycena latifolia]